jgi:hypothetical protein
MADECELRLRVPLDTRCSNGDIETNFTDSIALAYNLPVGELGKGYGRRATDPKPHSTRGSIKPLAHMCICSETHAIVHA